MQNNLMISIMANNLKSIKNKRNLFLKNDNSLQLNDSLFKNKSIILYSHYSNNNKIDKYNYYIINFMNKLVDSIFILSNINKDEWDYKDKNNIHILKYDYKGDFANYYIFINKYKNYLLSSNRIFLINDSFIVLDKNKFEYNVYNIFFNNKSISYMGLVGSNDPIPHYQSYFICINNNIINSVINYFINNGLPKIHEEAINKYELGLSSKFIDKKFIINLYDKNPCMIYPLQLISDIGIIKRQHLLNKWGILNLTKEIINTLIEQFKDNKEFIDFVYNK